MGVHFHAPYHQFLGCYNNIIYVLVHPFMCIFIVIVILAKFHALVFIKNMHMA